MKILIAEDESIIRLGLKSMLNEMGHDVYAASNAAPEPTSAARPCLIGKARSRWRDDVRDGDWGRLRWPP